MYVCSLIVIYRLAWTEQLRRMSFGANEYTFKWGCFEYAQHKRRVKTHKLRRNRLNVTKRPEGATCYCNNIGISKYAVFFHIYFPTTLSLGKRRLLCCCCCQFLLLEIDVIWINNKNLHKNDTKKAYTVHCDCLKATRNAPDQMSLKTTQELAHDRTTIDRAMNRRQIE